MINDRLQEIFRDLFEDDEIVLFDEMTADDVEEWDSLTHIQLIAMVQDEFSVKFTVSEILKLNNVGEFLKLIASKTE